MYDKLIPYFSKFIIENQHGFLAKRSTITNLSVYTNYLAKAIGSGFAVDSIYIDLVREYDRVNFELLLRKLYAYGILGSILSRFGSYLSGCRRLK